MHGSPRSCRRDLAAARFVSDLSWIKHGYVRACHQYNAHQFRRAEESTKSMSQEPIPPHGVEPSLGRHVILCRLPSGYAMYNRPIMTQLLYTCIRWHKHSPQQHHKNLSCRQYAALKGLGSIQWTGSHSTWIGRHQVHPGFATPHEWATLRHME